MSEVFRPTANTLSVSLCESVQFGHFSLFFSYFYFLKEYMLLFLTCFLIDRCQIVTDTMQSRFFLDVLYYNDIVIKQLYSIRKNYIRALSLVLYPDIYKELNVVENSK